MLQKKTFSCSFSCFLAFITDYNHKISLIPFFQWPCLLGLANISTIDAFHKSLLYLILTHVFITWGKYFNHFWIKVIIQTIYRLAMKTILNSKMIVFWQFNSFFMFDLLFCFFCTNRISNQTAFECLCHALQTSLKISNSKNALKHKHHTPIIIIQNSILHTHTKNKIA